MEWQWKKQAKRSAKQLVITLIVFVRLNGVIHQGQSTLNKLCRPRMKARRKRSVAVRSGGKHILAFQQAFDAAFPDRQSRQHQRSMRYALVARHGDAARGDRDGDARRQPEVRC